MSANINLFSIYVLLSYSIFRISNICKIIGAANKMNTDMLIKFVVVKYPPESLAGELDKLRYKNFELIIYTLVLQ